MEALIFDTTFLIDFQRERKLGGGEAHDFLRENAASPALLPVVAYGEFCEGFDDPGDPDFLSMVESFELVPLTSGVAEHYAAQARRLRRVGKLIGSNDLWIAATALEQRCPLVTRDLEHFARITGLQLRAYK